MSYTIYCQKNNCEKEAISSYNGEPYFCKKHSENRIWAFREPANFFAIGAIIGLILLIYKVIN